MYILEVYVTNASLNINHPFTYLSFKEVKQYARVEVIFNNRKTLAFVTSVRYSNQTQDEIKNEYGFEVRYINNIIDNEAIISSELYNLALWLSKVTISPFISCLNIMLPKTLKTTKSNFESKKITHVHKNEIGDIKLTKRQNEIFNLIKEGDLYSDILKLSSSIIKKLLDYNLITKYETEETYYEVKCHKNPFKELTNSQLNAYNGIIESSKMTNLLFGVTGSGKTEVYLHLARYYLGLNKQVLILVPEISLTPQMISRVKERFDNVAIYHSYLSDQERHLQYKRVLNKEVNIVVGTRSSIFLPFDNLGIIIIDEEHDHSYKQDNVPCYNAKMVAFKRAKDHNAKVLLASATPSLETYSRALKKDYGLFKLENRINEMMPNIEIVDMSNEIKNKGAYIISKPLYLELRNVLDNHKQAIILLNRRGYTPVIKCADCSEVLMCKDCESSLNYHKDLNILKCHICGRTYNIPSRCPNCGSKNLLQYGYGTKKVTETLGSLFKDARIGRMDRDNTSIKDGHQKILEAFEKKEIDILVGTQMIAKGLDFPNVILVGILNADAGLMHEDYNSSETTFDLLMQAAGRSGRANDLGKVIIQAFNPNHFILKSITNQSYESFFNIEMNYRLKAFYPPYSHILVIYLKDNLISRLEKSLEIIDNLTCDLGFKRYPPIKINKIKGYERYRIMFKEKDLYKLIKVITNVINLYNQNKNMSTIKVDIDPLYLE